MAEEHSLSRKSIRELLSMLNPKEAWGLLVVISILIGGSFGAGVWIDDRAAGSNGHNKDLSWWQLRVENLQPEDPSAFSAVRVVVQVNAEEYVSYPPRQVWGELSGNDALPPDDLIVWSYSGINLQFTAYLRPADPTERICVSQTRDSVLAEGGSPADGKAELFRHENGSWGGKVAEVTYSLVPYRPD